MSVLRPLALVAVCSLPLISTAANAEQNRSHQPSQGFLYGIGVGVNQEIYRGYKRRVIPLPLVGYRGDKLSVYGPFVSYELAKANDVSLSAKLAPRFAGYDDGDSDVFVGMKRKSSLDAGLGLQYRIDNWTLDTEVLSDVLGNSNGQEAKLKFSYGLRFGPLQVSPEVGVSYSSSKLVDYYYGVRQSEATADRPAYRAGAAVNYHTGVALSTPVFFGGLTRLGIEYHWYDTSIANSPLTDRDSGVSAFLAWSKFF
ncbi:MipA/OmpV family protein [Rheinheimera nanhaiensis]|uniref:Outer membrane protein n=1 Tax=Rheinheimera nanhaiensis E407-8 TaxID=562729 RepID=I1DXL0_9GAMM|nr:MipA/OmpV family protein [Rheinheimera nanhaiensis]GAB58788.1 outer membrane protein [Rheinheimera nanhaiensis E407-8]